MNPGNVIVRPDDMLEILAYYEGKYGRSAVPNALKRGMRDSFSKFDAYQIAKYRGETRDIKLVDVVNLVHPEPNDGNREALEALVAASIIQYRLRSLFFVASLVCVECTWF